MYVSIYLCECVCEGMALFNFVYNVTCLYEWIMLCIIVDICVGKYSCILQDSKISPFKFSQFRLLLHEHFVIFHGYVAIFIFAFRVNYEKFTTVQFSYLCIK